MSRIEQRNLVIGVCVVAALLAGGVLLADYSGVMRAQGQPQEQPKVGCAGQGTACSMAATNTDAAENVYASVDTASLGECRLAAHAAGACEKPEGCCEEKPAGCCEKPVGCCEKPAGCCEETQPGTSSQASPN